MKLNISALRCINEVSVLVILLLFLVISCSSNNENKIVGKWVSTTSKDTYYEFFSDKTAKVTVTLKNLNTKYYPDGKNTESSTGTWHNTGSDKFKAEINMNGVKTVWFIRFSGDTLFIKGEWAGANEESFEKTI